VKELQLQLDQKESLASFLIPWVSIVSVVFFNHILLSTTTIHDNRTDIKRITFTTTTMNPSSTRNKIKNKVSTTMYYANWPSIATITFSMGRKHYTYFLHHPYHQHYHHPILQMWLKEIAPRKTTVYSWVGENSLVIIVCISVITWPYLLLELLYVPYPWVKWVLVQPLLLRN